MPRSAIGLLALGLAYFMSQFYRSFLAVLYPSLSKEILPGAEGAAQEAFAVANGAWWLVFAIAQFPIGWALDKIGPRWTASVLLGIAGAGGCALFSIAEDATTLTIAMGLIGLGCAPVLMASYYIFARRFDPTRFATYAGLLIGLGTLGNVAASEPMAALDAAIGWRNAVLVLGGLALAIAAAIFVFVQDPPRATSTGGDGFLEGVAALFRIRALWLILPMVLMNYAAPANLRATWAGSFFTDVFAFDRGEIGRATLWMALAMAAATLIYGPLDRVFGTRKGVVIIGGSVVVGLLVMLALSSGVSANGAILLFALIGAFGHSYPVVMAHGQGFLPPHLVGRGVTFLNFFSIGGVALMNFLSAKIFEANADPAAPGEAYPNVFLFYAGALALGLAIYAFSKERGAPSSYWTRRRARLRAS